MSSPHHHALTKYPQGSIREILTISLPLMFSALSGNLMFFLDRLILANYSTQAMNACTAISTLSATLVWGFFSISSIAEVFVGQYNGSQQQSKMGEPTWQMLWFSLFTFALFIPLAFFGAPLFFNDDILAHGKGFYFCTVLCGPFIPMMGAISAFFTGQGKVKLIFFCSLFGNLINLLLTLPLVFGCKSLSIPPLGATGAGIATATAEFIQVAILLFFFLSPHNRLNFGTNQFKLKIKPFIQCLKIGTPNAIGHMIEISAWAIVYIMLTHKGTDHITVASIGQSLFVLFAFSSDGLQKAVIAIVSNLIGAQKSHLISKSMKSAFIVLLSLAAIFSIPLLLQQHWIINAFLPDSSHHDAVLHLSHFLKKTLLYVWLFFILDSSVWIFAGVLTAAGDTKYTMFMNAFSAWFFALLPCYYAIFYLNVEPGFTWAIGLLYTSLNCLAFFLRYKSQRWRTKQVIHAAQQFSPPSS